MLCISNIQIVGIPCLEFCTTFLIILAFPSRSVSKLWHKYCPPLLLHQGQLTPAPRSTGQHDALLRDVTVSRTIRSTKLHSVLIQSSVARTKDDFDVLVHKKIDKKN